MSDGMNVVSRNSRSYIVLLAHIGQLKTVKSLKKAPIVAAHLRVMRPTPSRQKDTLMLREELKHQN